MQHILLLAYPRRILAHGLITCQQTEGIADVNVQHGLVAVGIGKVDSIAVTYIHLIYIGLHSSYFRG